MKSGPLVTKPQKTPEDITLARLEQRVNQQDGLIKDMQKEIRRLRDKLSQHADHINRQDRG